MSAALLAEIQLFWGRDLLHRAELRPGRRFVLGPDPSRSNFVVPAEEHTVVVERSGRVVIAVQGDETSLAPDEALSLPLGMLTLSVRAVRDLGSRRTFAPWHELSELAFAIGGLAYFALVVAVALSVQLELSDDRVEVDALVIPMVMTNPAPPRLSIEVSEAPQEQRTEPARPPVGDGQMIFPETPAKERAPNPAPLAGRRVRRATADQRPGGSGARAALSEGSIGNPIASRLPYAWAIAGPADNTKPVATTKRAAADESAWVFILALRSSSFAWGPDSERAGEPRVASPFGEPDESGRDRASAAGNMFGLDPMDPLGEGLGVSGSGPGGGGRAHGIGVGAQGSLGHGATQADDQGSGVSDSSPFVRNAGIGRHDPRAPSVSTRVAPDVIARTFARNRGRIESCQARGTPAIVVLDAVIAPGGGVTSLSLDAETDLPAPSRACLERVVGALRFPASTEPTRFHRRIRL